ncbi:ABC transporter ATP-binding protein [Tistrella bauzanensis]|uniref:ABC transporter ATP-binding protein n=1 Tax=Tistrella arctica TaxID=3133430 RepID=A0ABU9YHY1_9PROT
MSDPVLMLEGLVRRFEQAGEVLEVLRGIDFTLNPGELVALVGPSGAGKSTLLHAAGLLERPDGGRVIIDGTDASRADDGVRTRLRRATIGFVYQFHHLLPEFSAVENVMMPQLLAGVSKAKARARANDLLDLMGLAPRADHRPARLSGGEQQRVAIARALANRPRLILADEPTGNLDPETAERVFQTLVSAARDQGVAALIATHNPELAARMDRRMRLEHGRLDRAA